MRGLVALFSMGLISLCITTMVRTNRKGSQRIKHQKEIIGAVLDIKVHTITIIDGDTVQDFYKPLFTKKKELTIKE